MRKAGNIYYEIFECDKVFDKNTTPNVGWKLEVLSAN